MWPQRLTSINFHLICYSYTVDRTCVFRNVVTTILDSCWIVLHWRPVHLCHIILSTAVNCISRTTFSRSNGAVDTQTTVTRSTKSDRWTSATDTGTRALARDDLDISIGQWTLFLHISRPLSFFISSCGWIPAGSGHFALDIFHRTFTFPGQFPLRFYRATRMHKRGLCRRKMSICPSVRMSHADILSTPLSISSKFITIR